MDHHPPSHSHHCCSEKPAPNRRWYQHPFLIWSAGAVLLYIISAQVPFLVPLHDSLRDYTLKMAVPMLMGLLLGGVIDYYVPQEYISKYLARRKKRTILYATGLGFLMSACSHGIIALSMELHKKGASGPAVVSFLLASPWANLPITFLLIGFFGWKGLIIVALALLVAVTTGIFFQFLDERGLIEKNPHSVEVHREFSILKDIQLRMKAHRFGFEDIKGIGKGIWDLADMVMVWIIVGILLASLAAAFVPMNIFQRFFGPSLLGLFFTMLAATVMEVCSEGTSPLAFEIYRQTGALGNAFAFLMGGVVTDYTEIGLLWKNLGPRTALWVLGITIPEVFILGWILNHTF